jgi:hypothetical protein
VVHGLHRLSLKAVLYPVGAGPNVIRSALCRGGGRAMQAVYVLQISDDIGKPVAYSTELLARDRAAIAAHDRGVTLDASMFVKGPREDSSTG